MAKFKVSFRKNFDVISLVKAIFIALVSLWVGGLLVNALGTVMNCTSSAFYQGLNFIGWTVGTVTSNGTTYVGTCSSAYKTAGTYYNVITDVSTGNGILVVVGIITMAALIMKFVKFSWR